MSELSLFLARQLKEAESGYNEAYRHYIYQKECFKSLLIQEKATTLYQKLYEKTIQELNSELAPISKEEVLSDDDITLMLDAAYLAAEKILKEEPNNEGIKKLIEEKKSSKGKEENYFKNYDKRLSKELSEILSSSIIDQYLNEELIKKGLNFSYSSFGALEKRVRMAMVSIVNGKKLFPLTSKTLSGYRYNLKGEARERLGTSILNKWAQETDNNISAHQTGSITGASGKQTAYDIIIGSNISSNVLSDDLEKIIKDLEKLNSNVSISQPYLSPLPAYASQVKSWYIPETTKELVKNASRQFYEIGNRKELYNRLNMGIGEPNEIIWERGWHAGVNKVSKVLVEAIGIANIFYITGGNKFTWTADLIKSFRRAGYYLNFYFKRATGQNRKYDYEYPAMPDAQMVWQRQRIKNMHKLKS